jgi:hypothetical protein
VLIEGLGPSRTNGRSAVAHPKAGGTIGQVDHHTDPVREDEARLAKKGLQNPSLRRREHHLTRKIRRSRHPSQMRADTMRSTLPRGGCCAIEPSSAPTHERAEEGFGRRAGLASLSMTTTCCRSWLAVE